jgi:predicted nucleic acid-binding protein
VIVLSDTSPINYLVLTGHIDILPALFGQVVIPAAVLNELQHSGTPAAVHRWMSQPPAWLLIRSAAHVDPQIRLGQGEAEAISLAVEMHASLLLMDDRRGRREAEDRGVSVAGTLNVLEAAAKRDLLDLPSVIAELRKTNFHISEEIIQQALTADADRRSKKQGPQSYS